MFILSQEQLKKLSFIAIFIFSIVVFLIKLHVFIHSNDYIAYDGAFYSDIALNVYNGNGLITNISSFDQFYKVLPRPAQVYPLWPFIGGNLAHLLPNSMKFVIKLQFINLIFSIFSLYLLYFLILNLLKELKKNKYEFSFIFTAFFYLTATYFAYITKPYTESLTIFLIFSSLLIFFNILDNKNNKQSKYFSLALGLLFFLSFLARSQSSIFIFVMFLSMIYLLYKKEILLKNFLIIWLSSFIFVSFYFYYLYTIRAEHFNFLSLLIFQDNYDLSKYPPLPHIVNLPFYLRFIHGIKAFFSFNYTSGVTNSGILIYLLPLTLFKFKYYNIKIKIIILIGAVYLLTLLSGEMTIALRWLFGHRHGILIIFLTEFSFLGYIIYLNERKNNYNKIFIFAFAVLLVSLFASHYIRKVLVPSVYKNKLSISLMNETYDFLKSEKIKLNRNVKIISLNARNLALFSRNLGYFFESRRNDWKEYLIYKMKYLNIDYFIINRYYDYYTKDKIVDYFSIMKDNTPDEFELVKSFKENKHNNWIGIYRLK